MNRYQNYQCEDFLLDDAFIQWVDAEQNLDSSIWAAVLDTYPEKEEAFKEAIAIRKAWKEKAETLPATVVEKNIQDILKAIPVVERKKSDRYLWLAASVGVVLVSIVGFLLYSTESAVPSADYVTYTNNELVDQQLILPDSSIAIVTPTSSVRYRENWSRVATREIKMNGNVFFQVKEDKVHPFVITSDRLLIKVLGTSFRVVNDKGVNTVVVKTGKVEVSDTKTVQRVFLTPNQEALLEEANGTLKKRLVANPVLIDTTLSFYFDNTPLLKVFETFEKGYGVTFIYDATRIKDCFVTLPFKEESFTKKMDILCRTIGANYDVVEGNVKMKMKGCN